MILNKEVLLKFFVICLISVFFFLGYFLRENAVGGGPEFYVLSWPIIQSFKEDFLFTIKNYGSFGDFTIPFSHILNAYINPFSNDIKQITKNFNKTFLFKIIKIFDVKETKLSEILNYILCHFFGIWKKH